MNINKKMENIEKIASRKHIYIEGKYINKQWYFEIWHIENNELQEFIGDITGNSLEKIIIELEKRIYAIKSYSKEV